VGAGFQAAIVGIDVRVDAVEILDLVLGLFFIDLTGDDFLESSGEPFPT
jgi:hypothetical protein